MKRYRQTLSVIVDLYAGESIARKTIVFRALFNRKTTNRNELGALVAAQLRQDVNGEYLRAVQSVVVSVWNDAGQELIVQRWHTAQKGFIARRLSA